MFEQLPQNTDTKALARLDEDLARHEAERAVVLQEKLEASEFGRRCRHEWAAEQRRQKTEHVIIEVLEVGLSPGAGALAAWRTKGGFPVGAVVNGVVGTGAKALSLLGPENSVARVAGNAGKVLLHNQIAITTYDLIRKDG
ncbi:hypothetical protein PPSIR1_21364 [Plesiocystis pacifica SIR-1]|uniref:Uncharacterized protein n=1 Tax=Plesiocystis pacifica SIR-1 TaxID=391625 RepID=A6G3L2_9BACT|nr:hypothetical protein [Plesiocystis pacifica]EDM79619.1 hypothetical protein PPSIR1_21364 [Plesiocystis pacifica SIR-1]